MNYFEKPMYTAVKTRGEILNLKCYEQYTAECNRAERQCSIAVLACACVGSCACVLAAYLKLMMIWQMLNVILKIVKW